MNAMIFKFGIEKAQERINNFYRLRFLLGKLRLIDKKAGSFYETGCEHEI